MQLWQQPDKVHAVYLHVTRFASATCFSDTIYTKLGVGGVQASSIAYLGPVSKAGWVAAEVQLCTNTSEPSHILLHDMFWIYGHVAKLLYTLDTMLGHYSWLL